MRAGFMYLGRGEIDDDVFLREGKATIDESRSDTAAAFLNYFVGESDNFDAGEASVAVSFYRDGLYAVAVKNRCLCMNCHARSILQMWT